MRIETVEPKSPDTTSSTAAGGCCVPPAGAVETLAAEVLDGQELRRVVRERYGAAARAVEDGSRAGCGCECGGAAREWDPITADLYTEGETQGLPAQALLASLGCGNPTALADLHLGEVVLDLGSGGGIDVLLSARRVGPEGKAYGLDMTADMLTLARENQRRAGVDNVEFLEGDLEAVPLPDGAVDVVISNCVLNLAADKRQALAEAFRVLRPGGRFAVSDVVVREGLPERARASMELWVGCVAGALEDGEYRRLLAEVGFEGISIEPTRHYRVEDARAWLGEAGVDDSDLAELDGKVMSAFVRATKPGGEAPARQDRPEGSTQAHARVLFLCTHNSARSQMAEGILRQLAGDRIDVASAGTEITRVHPLAVRAMAARGIDISGHRSKHLDELQGQTFDYVITVCDRASEACPIFPGDPARIHWSLPDPSAVEGDEENRARAFEEAANDLLTRIRDLLVALDRRQTSADQRS